MTLSISDAIAKLNSFKLYSHGYTADFSSVAAMLCERYLTFANEEREGIRSQIRNPGALLWFANESAELAVREGSSERIRLGLAALAIVDIRNDPRDSYIYLAVLNNSATKLSLDTGELFSWAESLGSSEFCKAVSAFAHWPDTAKQLEKFGVMEVHKEGQFSYEGKKW